MKIEVLGKGCVKCKKVYNLIEQVLSEEGKSVKVTHITDINTLMERGVMITPAVMVNGQLKVEGRMPRVQEIRGWLFE